MGLKPEARSDGRSLRGFRKLIDRVNAKASTMRVLSESQIRLIRTSGSMRQAKGPATVGSA